MSIVKVIEILAQSPESWEDATRIAVSEAASTVRNVRSVYIKEMQGIVEGDKIVAYRVNTKISFEVES